MHTSPSGGEFINKKNFYLAKLLIMCLEKKRHFDKDRLRSCQSGRHWILTQSGTMKNSSSANFSRNTGQKYLPL